MNKNLLKDQVLVIFGASGDLTRRKLIPAVFDLYMQKSLPENFAVLGVSRTRLSDESFRTKMKEGLKEFSHYKNASDADMDTFLLLVSYMSVNIDDSSDFIRLKEELKAIDQKHKTSGNYIFYLSTPPSLYASIPQYLADHDLNEEKEGFRRVIIEKPFGTDLESARALNEALLKNYKEDQIYRIDHYLGKETVQYILVMRFGNGIYEPLWNRNYVERVEITAAESIGVENRGGYYDHSGALRDMVQNHLLQLLALVAMEPPMSLEAKAIQNEKLKVFHALHALTQKDIETNIIRGQYLPARIKGEQANGYREEKDVDKDSRTETFFAMKLFVDTWRWNGVPFYIRTGKRLPTRVSEIVIHFKSAPQDLFGCSDGYCNMGNQLVLRIHPDEGILMKTAMKVPGKGYQVKEVNMDFHYSQLNDTYLPEAYERLLLDCMTGDSTLYIRGDALEATWAFVQPILDYWAAHPDAPLHGYPAGSWGPDCTDSLIEGEGHMWRYPCKNLSDDGIYCEL